MGPEDVSRDAEPQEQAGESGRRTGESQSSKSAVSVALPLGGKQAIQFFSLAPFAVAIFDRDLRYMAASKRWIKDYRLIGKRVLGKTQYEVFPHMADEWRDRYERCLAGEKFDEQESRFEGPNGTEWISWKMHPWTTDDGDIGGVILFSEFVSDQKRRTLELERNEAFLEVVLDSVHDGIVACDANGRLTLFNTATKSLHGLPAQPVQPDEWSEHYSLYRPDGVTPLTKEEVPLFRALSGERVDGVEMVIAPKGQDPRYVISRGRALYDLDGVKIGAVATMRDITEERHANAQLLEREQRFRTLYHRTPAMLHSVDRDGQLIRVSDFWLETLGYTREEVIGTRFLNLVPEASRAHVKQTILKFFADHGYLENVEFQIQKKSGETIDIQLSAVSEFDEAGERTNSLTVLTDITARKNAERELRRSEEQFRGAFESSPQGMALVSSTGTWINVNTALCTMLGYTEAELFARSIQEITHPEDLEIDYKNAKQLISGERHSYQMEKRYLHKDGSTVWAWISVMLMRDTEGNPSHYVIQMLNLTDRKRMERALRRSEEQFRSAFDASPQGMALISPAGTWLMVNTALSEMFGYAKDEFGELGLKSLTHPDDLDTELDDIKKLLDGSLDGNGSSIQLEKRYLRKDGETIWGQVTISLIRDEKGEPFQFVFQLMDLTKRKETEEQLVQAQKLEAVGQLTGGLAHDFNNLLAVILISLQLLERDHGDDPKTLKRIQAALDATERGADLTHRLLAFSRRQSLEQKILDVAELIEGMSELLKRTLGGGVKLKTEFKKDLWNVEVDQSQLETGLLNLAINARDAMPSGGDLTIEARNIHIDKAYAKAHKEVETGSYVLVAVSDTGVGIPAKLVDKVFQPFFTTKEVGKGTGLGLSMVYGFVKQSKGHIEVYSEEGVGTSIKLYLPALVDGHVSAVTETDVTDGEVVGGDEVILVTEDDPAVRQSVTSLFKSLGYRVVEAENGKMAVDILNSDSPIDLLFSDIVMPGGMDGIALAEKAEVLRPGIKILLTTGFAEGAVARNETLGEHMQIIGKPYRREDVAKKIRDVLERS